MRTFKNAMSRITGIVLYSIFQMARAIKLPVMSPVMMLAPGQFPSVADFRNYATTTLNLEVIKQDLYDTVLYPTAGMTNLAFFSTPQGQGLSAHQGNANAVKGLADTNMVLGGQLQRGQAFFIDNVQVVFLPGSVSTANTFTPVAPMQTPATPIVTGIAALGINDDFFILNSGCLQLTIGTKPYLQDAPLAKFPPQFRMESSHGFSGGVSGTIQVSGGSAFAGGMLYKINPGLTLFDGQSFGVNLLWPVVQATPSAFNGQMRVILGGWLARPVQ